MGVIQKQTFKKHQPTTILKLIIKLVNSHRPRLH